MYKEQLEMQRTRHYHEDQTPGSIILHSMHFHHYVDIEPKTEVVETPVIMELEHRSRKHHGKQLSTLYECDLASLSQEMI